MGKLLAESVGLDFVDADDLHPQANVELMAAGTPLTDADRWPWLDAVGAVLDSKPIVVACSALTRAYRDRLRVAAPNLRLVFLHGTRELLAERMGQRTGHFMSPTMLESQFATLEPPTEDERPLSFDVALSPERIVADAITQLGVEGERR